MTFKYNRLLGFDFGTKRIGVAIGQTITKTAYPLITLIAKNGKPTWGALDELMKKWQPDACVVGIPLNMDGTEQLTTHLARTFAEELRTRYPLMVFEVDERLTTKSAREQLFTTGGYKALQKEKVDSKAAQLILESYLQEGLE